MRVEIRAAKAAIIALKRESLVHLAAAADRDYVIEWDIVDARGKPVKRRAGVELSADITIKQMKQGWRYSSAGGAVAGLAASLAKARDAAATAAWRALAVRLADEDLARADAVSLQFAITTTSAWVVDHLASGDMHGGFRVASTFAALKKKLGPPVFDPFDGEPLYGWALRGRRGLCAWVGVRLRDSEDDVTEKDALGYAKRVTDWELAATNEKAAKSVIAWLRTL